MGCITFHIKALLILTMKIYRACPTLVKGADAFNAVFGFLGYEDKRRRSIFQRQRQPLVISAAASKINPIPLT
jgi:hypothetical protein